MLSFEKLMQLVSTTWISQTVLIDSGGAATTTTESVVINASHISSSSSLSQSSLIWLGGRTLEWRLVGLNVWDAS